MGEVIDLPDSHVKHFLLCFGEDFMYNLSEVTNDAMGKDIKNKKRSRSQPAAVRGKIPRDEADRI